MAQSDIKNFIDYFHNAVYKVRNEKAIFIRCKDGKLVERALTIFSRPQLEMLGLWFLAMKPKMSPTIGAMLSDAVLEELQKKIKEPHFWKELDILSQRYYSDANKCRDTIEPNYMFSNAELMALKNKLFKL